MSAATVSSIGVWVFSALLLTWAEVAGGTYPSTPTDYNWIQDQCNRPLSGDLSDCTLIAVVSDDCGCSSLKIVNRNTGAESTYKINVEDSGCLTILYNEFYFLVIIDQRTKAVTLKRSARFESEGSAIIFALNDEGDVCLCSGDKHGSVEYAVVIRNESSSSESGQIVRPRKTNHKMRATNARSLTKTCGKKKKKPEKKKKSGC